MKRARVAAALGLFACAVAFGACAAEPVGEDGHVEATELDLTFDKNAVLSDAELTDSSALSAAQIQAFLEDTECGTKSSLADYKDATTGASAAQLIADASSKYHLNPIEFLTRLQVERSLLCKPATQHAMDEALSCGCPDGAPCSTAYAGFGKQIDCAGYHLHQYLQDIATKGHTVAGWAPHVTKMSSDPLPVTPANAATAALYTYTPWVYNGGNNLHFAVWNSIVKKLGYHPTGVIPAGKLPPRAPLPCTSTDPSTPAGGCTSDAECNHGVAGTGFVCAKGGPGRGTCVDGCTADSDCPTGGTCDLTGPQPKCTDAPPAVGTACATDSECTGGTSGASRVCGNGGRCIVGCHSDADCGVGGDGTTKGQCDLGLKVWQCVWRKPLGQPCGSDAECNGGVGGTQRVCSTETALCTDACHADSDCDSGSFCDHAHATWTCTTRPAGSAGPTCHGASTCPVLTFPSGVKIQTKVDAVLEASYAGHLNAGETAPHCFLDVDDLLDPDTGTKHDYATVKLSDHFLLRELVGTEVSGSTASGGGSRRVLVDPTAVANLEQFRVAVATPFSPTSGYRAPHHQEVTCMGICGASYCPGKCARTSRHMHGDAFDLPVMFYSYAYAQKACTAGFHFAYDEAKTHLHVDDNPAYSTCVIQFD